MKKKIITLFLLVSMLVGVLVSCGYSFVEDDMGAYVSVKKDAFKELLNNIEIEDADFTNNDDIRAKQVKDAIATALANLSTAHKKSGKADGNDVVYYYYFIVDGAPESYATPEALASHTYVAYNSSKKTSLMTGSASNVVLGLEFIEDDSFTKKFYDAWASKDFEFVESKAEVKDNPETDENEASPAVVGNLYEIITSSSTTEEKKTTVTRTDVIYVTYTKKWTEKVEKDGAITTVDRKETYTDIRLWDINHLDDSKDAEDPFFKNFVGKTVGSVADFKVEVGEGDDKITYNYSGVSVNAIVKTPKVDLADKTFGAPIVIKYNPFVENTQTKLTAVDGSDITLTKDKELTYFIYPAYYTDTKPMEKLDAEMILEDLFGKSVTVDMFTEEALKYKGKYTPKDGAAIEKTLKEIIAGDKDAADAWKDSLKDVYSYISDATKHPDHDEDLDGKKENDKYVENSKEEIKSRYEGYLKERMNVLAELTNGKDGDDKLVADAILEAEYKTYTENRLKDAYYEDIKHSVQHEIIEIIEKIDVKSLPEDAVEELYETFYENAKYTFYKEKVTDKTSSDYNKTYYAIHDGDFDAYLIATYAKGKTLEDALAAIRDEAKAFAKLSVQIFFAAEAFGVKIEEDEYVEDYVDYYGEFGAKLASQLDKLMDHLLLMEGEKEFFEKEENAGKEYELQLDGKNNIKFANIGYDIKAETAEK